MCRSAMDYNAFDMDPLENDSARLFKVILTKLSKQISWNTSKLWQLC